MLSATGRARAAFLTCGPLRALAATQRGAATCATRPARATTRMVASSTPAAAAATDISGPAWDLSDEYSALGAPEVEADIASAMEKMDAMAAKSRALEEHLPRAREMSVEDVEKAGILKDLEEINDLRWDSARLLRNVFTYASCTASVDGGNEDAKKLTARLSEMFAKHKQAAQAATLFLDQATEDVVERYLSLSDATRSGEFLLRHSRAMRDHALSLAEENMLSSYQVPGISAWGALYTDLSGIIKVDMEQDDGSTKTMGVAAAAGLLDSTDGTTRKRAWLGIKNAWLPHTETCAAVLNAITAWRLETYKRRGLDGYMASPLHLNRMRDESLKALFDSIDDHVEVGRRALRIQAAALGKKRSEPWDLYAPAPVKNTSAATVYTFDEGIEVIANAVGAIDTEAGDFVRMMRDKKWIEATRGDSKRPGAYCTGFAKSRNPRVYLSEYNGRAPLLLTLAHELGHAYHSWVMRDMPEPQTSYPMNLAETASIFFETVVASDLLQRATSVEEKFAMTWNNAESAHTFLLNIPARFQFESDLNERRAGGKLSTSDIDTMMVDAWKKYYADSLDRLDEVGIFSATKLHFYISSLSFYNFPYTFGYCFSLGVYASKDKVGAESFSDKYRALLRDTGRMPAEEVVEKHLGGRIYEKSFWDDAIGIVRGQVDEFEQHARELGYVAAE